MFRLVKKVVCGLALVATPALAQISVSDPVVSRGGQGWSLYSGQTVGTGSNVVAGQLGWPGLWLTYLHGATNQLDFGARFTAINYGFESRTSEVAPGMKLQLVARLGLLDQGRFNLGFEFAPGPLVYFRSDNFTQWGLTLPLKLQMGLAVGSAMIVNFGIDFPMFVIFTSPGSLYLPILAGGGVEYFIDQRLAISFNLKMGPSIQTADTRTSESGTSFAMDALIGVAYRL
jgi:hypothetical protein